MLTDRNLYQNMIVTENFLQGQVGLELIAERYSYNISFILFNCFFFSNVIL